MMKQYISNHFKYPELGNNFSMKMKRAALELEISPAGYSATGFFFGGYDIYLKPYRTYLLFYTIDESAGIVTILRVLKDGMNWQYILKRWLIENR